MEAISVSLGEKVKQRRLERNWSSADLARRTGLDRGYLSRVESGKVLRPAADILETIARALETSVSDLLDRPDLTEPAAVPPSLRTFADSVALPEEVVNVLAKLSHQGRQPMTPDDWAFVWEAFKRSVRDSNE